MSYFLILASYFFYIRACFICQAELVLIYGAVFIWQTFSQMIHLSLYVGVFCTIFLKLQPVLLIFKQIRHNHVNATLIVYLVQCKINFLKLVAQNGWGGSFVVSQLTVLLFVTTVGQLEALLHHSPLEQLCSEDTDGPWSKIK